MAIPVEDPERIVLLEVLPLDDGRGKDPSHRVDERLEDLVVRPASQPRRSVAEIEWVLQQLSTVRPHIERYRQRPGRIDAGRGGIESELADGDRHPAGTEVPEAQDPLVVGHDDQPDLGIRGSPQDVVDAPEVVRRDPDTPRSPEDVAEVLTGTADGRRVDDGQEFFEVLRQDPVEERLVPILEGCQADVALEVVGLAADVLELEGDLLLDRVDTRRQEAAEAEHIALLVTEGGALVEERLADQLAASAVDRQAKPRRLERAHIGRGLAKHHRPQMVWFAIRS